MRYFFKPRFELLADAKVCAFFFLLLTFSNCNNCDLQVWVNAMSQTFNSMGIAFGSMISFASYNKFNNNILHDTLAVSFVNALTSLLVGIFSFAIIGNIASEQNTSIERVIADGKQVACYYMFTRFHSCKCLYFLHWITWFYLTLSRLIEIMM